MKGFSSSLFLSATSFGALTGGGLAFLAPSLRNLQVLYTPLIRHCDAKVSPSMSLSALAKKAKIKDIEALQSEIEASGGTHPALVCQGKKGSFEKSTKVYDALKRPTGTLSIVSEYKRKIKTGFIADIPDPKFFSAEFRAAGASVVSVNTDSNTGGCTYADVEEVFQEQATAKKKIPGPMPVICNDLIIDELQLANAKGNNADAVVLSYSLLGAEELQQMAALSAEYGLEVVVSTKSDEEFLDAKALGYSMVLYGNGADLEASLKLAEDGHLKAPLVDPTGPEKDKDGLPLPRKPFLPLVAIDVFTKDVDDLREIGNAWKYRDAGWGGVWVTDILYRDGLNTAEGPIAVIRALKSKASVEFASVNAFSGLKEGAREYLGYLEM